MAFPVASRAAQKPLELILARNLLTSISTPAALVDRDGRLLFYNEAAGALLGRSFEESGQMEPDEWTRAFGPLDDDGEPIPLEQLALTKVLREGRPMHTTYRIRSDRGVQDIEASSFPLFGASEEETGAMVLWWPREENGGSIR
jgi:PAS domain-containing protein